MAETALAKRDQKVNILAVYKPEQYNVLTPVKVYDAPPPFIRRVAVPVNITADDFHQLTGKDSGKAMVAASGLQKMAAALGFRKDTERSGFQEPPTRTHAEDCMYVMYGQVLLDQGWTDVQAQYTWRYEHVAALLGDGSDRFKAELRWKESKAETGALSRIVCHLLGIKRTRPKVEWEKPVVIVRDEPDTEAMLDDPVIGPEMRRALAAKAIGATAMLYGTSDREKTLGRHVMQHAIQKADTLMLGSGANEDEPEGDWEPIEDRPANVDSDGVIHEQEPTQEATPDFRDRTEAMAGPPPEVVLCFRCGKPASESAVRWSRTDYGASITGGRDACTACGTELNNAAKAAKGGGE